MQEIKVFVVKIRIDFFDLILEYRFTQIGAGKVIRRHLHLCAISELARLIIISTFHEHSCI